MRSVNDVVKVFREVEERHNALHLEISEVRVWLALRLHIYYEIAQKIGMLDRPHQAALSRIDKLKNSYSYIYNSLRHNPFLAKKSTLLIVPHSRKVLSNNVVIDIYTNDFINVRSDTTVLEKHDGHRHQVSLGRNAVAYDFFSVLSNAYSSVFKAPVSKEVQRTIKAIEDDIEDQFSVSIDLLGRMQKLASKFKVENYLVKKFLKKKSIQEIVLAVSYGHPVLIHAAKSLGIKVTEVQHGVINKYHLGYEFPTDSNFEHPFFPDELIVWQDMWKQAANFPIPPNCIFTRELQYFAMEKRKLEHVPKKTGTILCLSQGVNGERIAAYLEKNIQYLENYEIIFKLHPSEYNRWKSYLSLVNLSKYKNVKVISDNKESLHKMMKSAEYALGVFSTAMFEAYDYKCKLLVLELPGLEYMSFLLNSGEAKLVPIDSRLKLFLS
ncbi:hypothetical protein SAMN06297229_0607 [Pseudidiomarina planktonica]|uniref:Capsule polysaccharide biosynthesis protein n=1 Tax=Pseudidiomarina planktonica TaxID=1323738 RepID=A0A1Y6EGL5_9GAMM|nr:hypothetical protein [Pseudidiomarina planktonica]RUO65928.1 hypothetical protein CWI77_05725 [Pseudidiomarina planktonica]SMQ61744.1 hypothetical protein SAMN06297229_0607 [Pseudidiomarina planktonica]